MKQVIIAVSAVVLTALSLHPIQADEPPTKSGEMRFRFELSNLCRQRGFAIERMTTMGKTALDTVGIRYGTDGDTTIGTGALFARATPDTDTALDFLSLFIITKEHRVAIDTATIEAMGSFRDIGRATIFVPEGQSGPKLLVTNPEAVELDDRFVRGTISHKVGRRSPVRRPGAITEQAPEKRSPSTRYAFKLTVEQSSNAPDFTLPGSETIETYRRHEQYTFRASGDSGPIYTLMSTVTSDGFAFKGPDGRINPTIEAKAGDTVTLRFINRTHGQHNLCVEGKDCTGQLRYSHGCSAPTTRTMTMRVEKEGERDYFCSIRTHRQRGMEGTIRVSD